MGAGGGASGGVCGVCGDGGVAGRPDGAGGALSETAALCAAGQNL